MEKWLQSIYSDSGKEFVSNPNPHKGETIQIKIRMLKNEKLQAVFLRVKEWGLERLIQMQPLPDTGNLLYYQAEFTCQEKKISYQFYILTETEIYYYTQHRITNYIPDESRDFVILVDYDAPSWVGESVFYQILPDRFASGKPELSVRSGEYQYQGKPTIQLPWGSEPPAYEDSHCLDFFGGDLYGIIDKLDYLKDLGVTALYLNPIFLSPTMHKYDCLDYFTVDAHLGGDDALAELCKQVHLRNMKIILDISVNHTSSAAKWFNKECEFYPSSIGAYHNPDSPEREYYFMEEDGSYDTWVGVPTMPKLNYGSESLRNVIYKMPDSVLKKWLNPPYSIDGWRFDVADCMARNAIIDRYHEVWRDIRTELKAVNPSMLILAEDWSDCTEMLKGQEWDSTMNYFGCTRPIREFAGEVDLFHVRNSLLKEIPVSLTAKQLKERILQFYSQLPTIIANQMFNLIDSHDVSRLHNNPKLSLQRCQGAVITMFALPGCVNIYYGDEKFLAGTISTNEGCRFSMDWQNEQGRKPEFFELYKKLAHLKQNSSLLHHGGFKIPYAKDEIICIARFSQNELLLFVWSRSDKAETICLDIEEFGFLCPECSVFHGNFSALQIEKHSLKIQIPSQESGIIRVGNLLNNQL